MRINKDTQLCISVAARPGDFGTIIHNKAYRALGLNFIYKACAATNIASVIAGVRGLGIRGCGVSMPFKETVIPHLDRLDPAAEAMGAVNTIVNDGGALVGYNTDVVGAAKLLELLRVTPADKVLLLGAGGFARATLHALAQADVGSVTIANRNMERARVLAAHSGAKVLEWERRESDSATVVINATSVGMAPETEAVPIQAWHLPACRAVGDAIVMPLETALIRDAREHGLSVAPGYLASLEQAAAQIRLYTGLEAPRAVLENALMEMLKCRRS